MQQLRISIDYSVKGFYEMNTVHATQANIADFRTKYHQLWGKFEKVVFVCPPALFLKAWSHIMDCKNVLDTVIVVTISTIHWNIAQL